MTQRSGPDVPRVTCDRCGAETPVSDGPSCWACGTRLPNPSWESINITPPPPTVPASSDVPTPPSGPLTPPRALPARLRSDATLSSVAGVVGRILDWFAWIVGVLALGTSLLLLYRAITFDAPDAVIGMFAASLLIAPVLWAQLMVMSLVARYIAFRSRP